MGAPLPLATAGETGMVTGPQADEPTNPWVPGKIQGRRSHRGLRYPTLPTEDPGQPLLLPEQTRRNKYKE